MPQLVNLLSRGYFPKELPPPFKTESFAAYITSAALHGDFAKSASNAKKMKAGKPCRYSLARGGLQRRPLSICHPIAQFLLCKEMVASWTQIQSLVAGTAISATEPTEKSAGRAIDGRLGQNARPAEAQKKRLGKRFVLQADVSRFHSSIYTHSIPWAMHTKPVAKANRSMSLLGNRIDTLVRLGQDQQTVGIPIGPDTSLVIAEIIMHKCDASLTSKVPELQGFRFIDDYELSFTSQADAERAHYALESCLAEFELALNPKKTSIRELPLPSEASWATALKRAKPRKSQAEQRADLSHYFDIAFALHEEYPEDAVLQFAISVFQFEKIHPENWELFQNLLMLCALPEPACFPGAMRQIIQRVNEGLTGIIPQVAGVANSLIVNHSPLKHSSEVAHAAYACSVLKLSLSEPAVDAISQCDDPVIALLALDCEKRNLTSKLLDKSLWSTHMNADSLYDEFWLLAYEANAKGWLPNDGGNDFVAADANFAPLKAAGVHFYDATLNGGTPPTTVAISTVPISSGAPAESYGPGSSETTTVADIPSELKGSWTIETAMDEADDDDSQLIPPEELVVPSTPDSSL